MIATGTITGGSNLKAGADPQTSNADTLAHDLRADIRCLTNSLAQIRVDADGGSHSDPQEVDIALALPGGTFTAVAATNVITTSVNHLATAGDPIRFHSTGVAPGGINTGITATADATSDVVTATAHGRKVGDQVEFTNSGGALPAGIVTATVYYVLTVPTANTMTIGEVPEGDTLDITDAGTGAHTLIPLITYYVLTTPGANTMTVSAVPGGSTLDITTTGTGTHSFQSFANAGASLIYAYPITGPTVPPTVKQKRGGGVDDFTNIRGIHIALIPTDATLAASGRAILKMGDPTDEFAHFSVALSLTYDPDVTNNAPCFWTGALPDGLAWNTSYPLKLKFEDAVITNLSALINILGN